MRWPIFMAALTLLAPMMLFASEDSDADEEYIRYKDTVFRKQLQLLLPKSQVCLYNAICSLHTM